MSESDMMKKYLGIPYRHMGRDPQTGLDCWGLIKCIYADAGFDITDLDEYARNWANSGENFFLEKYPEQFEEVVTPHRMDIVLFSGSKGVPNHAGVVLTGNRFIHTCRAGTVIGRLGDLNWYKRIHGFYRLKAIIYDKHNLSAV